MTRLRPLVDLSIRRACGFAALAIVLTVSALMFDPVLALRVGGAGSALVVAALLLAAWRAPRKDIRDTEIYGLLRSAQPPLPHLSEPGTKAQIAAVLRARLLWHAERAMVVPLVFWGLALGVWLLG
jgi:hypothetical protein